MTYQHTQVAYWMLAGAALLAAVIASRMRSLDLFGVTLLVVTLGWTIFGTLTTVVDHDTLHVRFGPIPLIRKRLALADIRAARAVRNKWWYGFGMRWIPRGRLWNVWGYDAVELELTSGTRFRIGTDEPRALLDALRQAGVPA